MKHVRGQYGIVALVVAFVGILLVLVVLQGWGCRFLGLEGFQSEAGRLDCKGVTCEEGQFCQDNVCKAISPPYTNQYFPSGPA